ncbi:hypothetical protein [Martelella alba]|uniref:Uncharacterized protein n=1 Tax=Martelella alba TaxID=2590451 RepID=A0ABY2SFE3_9HYPH|nr:hypothetical protein [Martelella alba]TKI02679.1 hypothetical protein FCN80_24285 [Martelella alba]
MGYAKKGYLKETLHFKSDAGISYKYEIYQKSDGTGFYALISRFDPVVDDSDMYLWVYQKEELPFGPNITIVEDAANKAEEHFNENLKAT